MRRTIFWDTAPSIPLKSKQTFRKNIFLLFAVRKKKLGMKQVRRSWQAEKALENGSTEMLVEFQRITLRNKPANNTFPNHCSDDLKS
jgi:hypothetical protein